MKKYSYKFFILIQLIALILATPAFAQDASSGGADNEIIRDSMQDLSIVVGLGAGGAVLGLSTLSFVNKPKDHLNNILIGASIGIIIGVAAVAYKQATKSNTNYRAAQTSDFETSDRLAWHESNAQSHQTEIVTPFNFNYSFSF